MINIYLDGYKNTHDIFELVRILTKDDEIFFIENYEDINIEEGLTIVCSIKKYNCIEAKLYKKGILKSEYSIEDIENMSIRKTIEKKFKIALKKVIYTIIFQSEGYSSPWGILSGIRPSKIVHELREKGCSDNEINNIMTQVYLISEKNSKLLLDITNIEKKYLYPLDKNKFSLYISIPFCPTKCLYCSFPSYPMNKWEEFVEKYVEALLFELDNINKIMKNKDIQTVYIGGGTPTALSTKLLEKIINKVNNLFNRKNILEFTVEAGRPDTITKEKLLMLKRNKVDRISINPQTMSNTTLSLVGRDHTSEDIVKVYKMAEEIGFKYINMDIIVGLPNEREKDIEFTMEKISELNPDNLTVHTLAIKKASQLNMNKDKYDLKDFKSIKNMISITKDYATKMGMEPYYMYRQKQILGNFENIGYTKKDEECIYNIVIMEEKQTIIGVGAGAISKVFYPSLNKFDRVANVKDLPGYINRIDEMIERKKKAINNMLTLEK